MLDAWDGPFEGQALRRAARIADRVVVLVRSGEMTGLRLNAIKRRIGRQHGIGYVVLGQRSKAVVSFLYTVFTCGLFAWIAAFDAYKLGARLAALHNLRFYMALLERSRAEIAEGGFARLRAEIEETSARRI